MSPIPAIGALAGPPAPIAPISATSGASGTAQAGGAGFGDIIGKAIANTEQAQSTADNLAVKAATGDLTDAHESDQGILGVQANVGRDAPGRGRPDLRVRAPRPAP